MFGETIDYHLLKPLTHGGNRATEAELDARATESTFQLDDARAYVDHIQLRFGGSIPVDPELSYLDVGCGIGRLSIGLALAGARDVTGVDVIERHVDEAKTIAGRMDPSLRPEFHYGDIHDWSTARQYDVVIVLGAMEHIREPEAWLARLPQLMKPGGLAFVSHEPFQSPSGDHMSHFFRVQIPWRGLLFSEKAILRLRRERYRPTDPATRYQDVAGGLNLMSFTDYDRYLSNAGLEVVSHRFNPQLGLHARYRLLQPISWLLTRIPHVRDYFTVCVFSVLRRAPAPDAP